MGLMMRLKAFLTGQALRIEDLASLLKAQIDRPEGAATLGLPRPFMALGTLALIAAAMIDPVWFSARMTALAQMPEALWWLIGAVISLFFGARYQTQGQQFQREVIGALVPTAAPVQDMTPRVAATGADARLTLAAETLGDNLALANWLATQT